MKDIKDKNSTGKLPRQGGYSLSLTLRELGTNEHKDEDALSTLEIAAKIDAEKIARAAEEAAAPAGSPHDERAPEAWSPAGRCSEPWDLGLDDIENTKREDMVQDEQRLIPKLIRVLKTVEETTDGAGDVKWRVS